MNRTTELRENILTELDGSLALTHYKRPKREQSWRRKVSTEQTFFIHLNFGLYERSNQVSIIPSVSLRSQWLADRELECGMMKRQKDSRHHAHFGKTLTCLSGHSFDYRIGGEPQRIAKTLYQHIVDYGLPYLEQIKDYDLLADLLRSDNVRGWPVVSRSDRARYLPLLLAMAGKEKEAFQALISMEADILGRDQIIPGFDHFKNWFVSRFAANAA